MLCVVGEAGVRGSEEIAMRDHPFLKDVLSELVGTIFLIRRRKTDEIHPYV